MYLLSIDAGLSEPSPSSPSTIPSVFNSKANLFLSPNLLSSYFNYTILLLYFFFFSFFSIKTDN